LKFILFLITLFFCGSASAESFTYADLVHLIQQKNITSIEDLLPQLPETFRSNYTLMHTSGSLQEASFTSPRAILFGEDASLTCTFNGDSAQNGFDNLECFQFQPQERSFDFRQIAFPSPRNHLKGVAFSNSGQSADGTISCSDCHGSDPRPNWDGYPAWPGAYGSNDDLLGDEQTQYTNFVNLRTHHPRYQWLVQGALPSDPYVNSSLDVAKRPNLRLSDLLGRMNAFRTARILEGKVSEWQSLAFAFSSLGCVLNGEQKNQIANAKLPFSTDTNLNLIFKKLQMPANEWSTEIESLPVPQQEYEHQSGFSYLAADTAMVLISERAAKGDQDFQKGLTKLINRLHSEHKGSELDFYKVLFGILPDPDLFGGKFAEKAGYFCPELSRLFVAKYLASQ
jgi:hypothetical protein